MTSAGQKVTTDPASKQPIYEGVGVVTSDSLAAESLRSSGSFGAGNPKAAVSKQPSASTTTNTTDTSAATTLNPARTSEDRDNQPGGGVSLSTGSSTSSSAQTGAAGLTSATGGVPSTSESGSTGVPIAPTGVVPGSAIPHEAQKPKGTNITEGGFNSGAPNASWTTEIGTKKDPGRVAEDEMARRGAPTGLPAQGGLDKGTVYDALKSEEGA